MRMMFCLKVVTLVTILALARVQARNIPGYAINILVLNDHDDFKSIKGELFFELHSNCYSISMPRWLVGIVAHRSKPNNLGKDELPPPPPPQADTGPGELSSYIQMPLKSTFSEKY
ncbi:hypothetical protein SASPL_118012 [Salvia splendens]|uniref:Dirigent protein n=1 Tax=Salvia splendens TaxID=180675 RepID=A0A8X8XYL9_SALSN|nr:hypothetical protein SASPL_118012 [Salvia splendens]